MFTIFFSLLFLHLVAWGRNLEIIFSYLGLSMHILKVVLHDEVTFLHNVKSRAILNQKKNCIGLQKYNTTTYILSKKIEDCRHRQFLLFFYRKFKWESELRKVRFYSCFRLTQCILVSEWHKPSCTWKNCLGRSDQVCQKKTRLIPIRPIHEPIFVQNRFGCI